MEAANAEKEVDVLDASAEAEARGSPRLLLNSNSPMIMWWLSTRGMAAGRLP